MHVTENLILVFEEVQGVCHHDAVELGQALVEGKVIFEQDQVTGRIEAGAVGGFQFLERGAVFIQRVDGGVRSNQFTQCQSERAASRAEIRVSALRQIGGT